MDKSKRKVVQFLEKEIKTYKALALFLSKEEIKKHLRVRGREGLIHPPYYRERMREARKLIRELRKAGQSVARFAKTLNEVIRFLGYQKLRKIDEMSNKTNNFDTDVLWAAGEGVPQGHP